VNKKNDFSNYKQVEANRYNKRSENVLNNKTFNNKNIVVGSDAVHLIFRRPYLAFEKEIKKNSSKGKRLLDVCCGDGLHSFSGVKFGDSVVVSDIAEKSVELVLQKALNLELEIQGVVADAEKLPFAEKSFDIITCAGSLSYVDIKLFVPSIYNILDVNGVFIAVDSFNYNIFYKFNRFLHYLKGERTWKVNSQIPDFRTIKLLKSKFSKVEVRFYGIFLFLAPLLKFFFNDEKVAIILENMDSKYSFLRKFAFKIVIIAHK